MDADTWYTRHTEGAPTPLRDRARALLRETPPGSSTAETIARAAVHALSGAVRHPGDRSIALDLLAADALVTLSLEARAESDPESLARFANRLRHLAFEDTPPA